MSLATVLLLTLVYAAPPTPVIECEKLLRQHIQTAANVRPWAKLPRDLANNVKEATVLIRLPLDLSGNTTLATVSRMVEGDGNLAVPEPLKIVSGFGLFVVARGSAESLVKLYGRLKGTALQYQILDYVKLRELSLPFPDRIYRANGDVAKLIEQKGPPFVALSQVRGGQLLFFIPREMLAPLLDADILKENRVAQYHIRVPPADWSAWIEDKGDFFKGKGIVLSNYWAVVSAGAFQVLNDLQAEFSFRHGPTVANVEAKLLEQLNRCFSTVCPVVPQGPAPQGPAAETQPQDETLSYANRRLILDFLKDHRKSVALSSPYGVRHAFMALADLIVSPLERSQYKSAIKGIAFVSTEYVSISGEDNATFAAVERMMRAWRAFLAAKKLPQATAPLTRENIKAAIEASGGSI